jgi:hypothetical protein
MQRLKRADLPVDTATRMVEGACVPAPPHASRMNDEAQVELVRCEG